ESTVNPYREGASGYNSAAARSASLGSVPNDYSLEKATPNQVGAGMSAGEGTGRPGERALEGPQNAALVMQKIAPSEIQVGKKAKFLIKVQNVGNQTAEEV